MNPLVMIAARVLPEILKFIVDDKAGAITERVANAVADATQTKNPEAAREKINTDPNAYATLQLKLAEIAADQEQKRQQAQLDLLKAQHDYEVKKLDAQLVLLKAQYEEDAKKRDAELAQMRVASQDTANARESLRRLAGQGGWIASTTPILSYLVISGFFVILVVLLFHGIKTSGDPGDQVVQQIINIVIGALVAGFATVVNFWLGSSQGSRLKDIANVDVQETHARETAAILEKSAQQNADAVEKSMKQTEAFQSTIRSLVERAPAVHAAKTPNLQRCVDIVIVQESVSRRAAGEGGAQFGITLEELRIARNDKSLTADDLSKLTRDQAREIYRARYWNVLNCDDLPVGVDLVTFDFGVEVGPTEAARVLQAVVGAGADGSIGPATVAAAKAMPPRDFITTMTKRRLEYYRKQSDWAEAGEYRTDRATAVQNAALTRLEHLSFANH
jgi:hypothetical protein